MNIGHTDTTIATAARHTPIDFDLDNWRLLEPLQLTRDEARVYWYLLHSGQTRAKYVIRDTKLSRPLVYRALERLTERSLVETITIPGKITEFRPSDPRTLRTRLVDDIALAESRLASYQAILPLLVTTWNRHVLKPYIETFEGIDSFISCLRNTFITSEEVSQAYDPAYCAERFPNLIERLTHERIGAGQRKRVLAPDSPGTRSWWLTHSTEPATTERRLSSQSPFPSNCYIIIQNDSTLIATLHPDSTLLTTSMHNPVITDMYRTQFETAWKNATPA